MDIDVQGAKQFHAAFPASVLIFMLPPSVEVLLDRLAARKTESPEALALRLRNARDELHAIADYHYVVVNDDLERAVAQVGVDHRRRERASRAAAGARWAGRRAHRASSSGASRGCAPRADGASERGGAWID